MNLSISQRIGIYTLKILVGVLKFIEDTEKTFIRHFQFNIISLSLIFIFYFANNYSSLSMSVLKSLYPNNYNGGIVLGADDSKNLAPFLLKTIEKPDISAKSALVIDVTSGKILYGLNTDEKLAPASTTKLMTAVIALDIYSLDEKLAVPGVCTNVEGQKAGLYAGMIISVKDLVNVLLINSSGDAACVLSWGVTSYSDFVNLMNLKTQKIGMKNTRFTNSIGLDGENGSHYSTANDLYKLAKYAIKNKTIKDIVKTKEYALDDSSRNFEIKVFNTNKLLWDIPETVGIKTGTTQSAGEVLIYEYKTEEKDLIIVVMGSDDRFSDTKELLNWTLESYYPI